MVMITTDEKFRKWNACWEAERSDRKMLDKRSVRLRALYSVTASATFKLNSQ